MGGDLAGHSRQGARGADEEGGILVPSLEHLSSRLYRANSHGSRVRVEHLEPAISTVSRRGRPGSGRLGGRERR